MKIETSKLIQAFGTQDKVAKFFDDCTQQAVQQWGEYIPKLRAYELRDRRPDIFDQIKHGKYD
jgi:hypothetical protein